jgi:hypothetical protein
MNFIQFEFPYVIVGCGFGLGLGCRAGGSSGGVSGKFR